MNGVNQLLRRIRFDGVAELQRARQIAKMRRILEKIEQQFPNVLHTNQVRQKHVRWIVTHWFVYNGLQERTNLEYRSALLLLLEAMDRTSPSWLKQAGLLLNTSGGRPRKAKVVRSRAPGIRRPN